MFIKNKIVANRVGNLRAGREIAKLVRIADEISGTQDDYSTKIGLMEKAITSANVWKSGFRTFDVRAGIPESLKIAVKAIYDYSVLHARSDLRIVRLGNGEGRDLLIQKLLLRSVGVRPEYYLVDYDIEQHKTSACLDPDIDRSHYVHHDLFEPLLDNRTLKDIEGEVDIIDCQQVLHEIISEGCGGSHGKFMALLGDCSRLLRPGGLVVLEDVNIVEDDYNENLTFSLSAAYSGLFEKFYGLMEIGDLVEKKDHNRYTCPVRWLTVFCYLVLFLRMRKLYNCERELQEIHRNLTRDGWIEAFRAVGMGVKHLEIFGPPEKIRRSLQLHMFLSDGRSLPPFSISIVAEKEKR